MKRSQLAIPIAAACLALLLAGCTVAFDERGPDSPAGPTTPAPSDTTSGSVESPFAAAATQDAGAWTKPTADEVALVSDPSRYQWDDSTPQVSATGNFAALQDCGPSPATLATHRYPPVCTMGWAYQTGSVDGGEVHRGWLGAAEEPEVFPLDDRFFVAIENSLGLPRPPTAWLIDSATGGHAGLTWRDEPTTVNSRAQALVVSDGPSSVPRLARRQAVPDFSPRVFLPRVVDGRDGTIRPLAVPDSALADLLVIQKVGGRIWVGTTPDGDNLGLAYSDDGGGTWTDVALPAQLPARADELEESAAYSDLLLSIAADRDRIAVTDAWSYDPTREVYVSEDAGQSWSTVPVANHTPWGNGAHLYVLAEKQLLLVQSADPYAIQLLGSTASDWTKLERNEPGTQATKGKYVDVNREGVVSMYYSVAGFDRGEIGGMPDSPPIRHHFSTDLTNWQTIAVLDD